MTRFTHRDPLKIARGFYVDKSRSRERNRCNLYMDGNLFDRIRGMAMDQEVSLSTMLRELVVDALIARQGCAMSQFDVELPLPPSLNNAYFNARGRGRVMSDAYRNWKVLAMVKISTSVPFNKTIHGPVSVSILLPEKMRGDVDNRIKPILDALVASGRIDDDRKVMQVSAAKRLLGKTHAFVSVAGMA